MSRSKEIRFVVRSLRAGLWQIFRSSPILALLSFLLIIAISSIIPLAFVHLLFSCFSRSFSLVTLWSSVEVIFFFYQLVLFVKIQQRSSPPILNDVERDHFVSCALTNIKDLRTTLSKWFLDCPFDKIDRYSLICWLAFAFYSKDFDQLTSNEFEQIDSFIDQIELTHQIKVQRVKSDEKIFYMKHILDPVRVIFRPFAFYFVTDTILNGILCRSLFHLRNYQFVQIGHLQFWTFRHSSLPVEDEQEAIVFFHGIGSGLLFYQPFIAFLHRTFSARRRLIFISMSCVSLRYPSLKEIPNLSQTTESIQLIFERYQLKKAVFIGHSYGTACLSWLVQNSPEYISKLIFLDPICFALFEPTVVFNFVYRTPTTLAQLYMFYFVCRELGVSYVVSRHFWWTQNNLYLEQIRSCSPRKLPVFVLLAQHDCIVNSRLVRDYLLENQIEVFWAERLSHAGLMANKICWKKISQWIVE